MFEIDRNTGTFRYKQYQFSIDLTYQAFLERYPELSACEEARYGSGVFVKRCELPSFCIDDHKWLLNVGFVNRYISSIRFRSAELRDEDYTIDGPFIWWQKALTWLKNARALFEVQLGLPNRQFTPFSYEYDNLTFMSDNDKKLLDEWIYTFPWGTAWLGYDSDQESLYAQIVYDTFQQITNWDDFVVEHEYKKVREQDQGNNQSGDWDGVAAAINLIKDHFDYRTFLPHSNEHGVMFRRQSATTVSLELKPDRSDKKYFIRRSDTLRKAYADDTTLVETLRLFLESESL